jgi:hypothetical protein
MTGLDNSCEDLAWLDTLQDVLALDLTTLFLEQPVKICLLHTPPIQTRSTLQDHYSL